MTRNLALIGQEAAIRAHPPDSDRRERASLARWSGCRVGGPVGAAAMTTHSRPLQGLPGPAPLSLPPLGVGTLALAGYRYSPGEYPPGIPTRYYPPGPYPRPATLLLHPPHVLYTAFEDTVGEPRGSRTHRYIQPQEGI